MRQLEQHKILYTVREFPKTIHSADGVADYFELPHSTVYKTLVIFNPKNRPMLVMVAGNRTLNLKKLAKSIGEKKITMASHKEAERLTGLQTGGISALALLNKNFPVYIDSSAQRLETILVSAGKRGVNIELAVDDLIKLTQANVVQAS